jgi:hypothetical protein
MVQIRQFKITARHDSGVYSMVIYGHSSEKSAVDCFLDIEKAPLSCILKVEDLSTAPRTTFQSLI